MLESGLNLEHALDSVALIRDMRIILNSATRGRSVFSQEIDSLSKRVDKLLENTPQAHIPEEWRVIVAGLRVLASQIACLTIAQGGEGDLLSERTKCEVLVEDLRRLVSSSSLALSPGMVSTRQLMLQKEHCNSDELRAFLLSIPLATLYWHALELRNLYQGADKESEAESSSMLRVIVFLDHIPIASPQLLKSSILYPLVFRVRGLTWPHKAIRLRLDLLTTCPQSEFSVSEFAINPPHWIENGEYSGEVSGHIKFNSGQSSLLDDLIFTVRGAFETSEGDFEEIPVIGHNELRLRVVSEYMHPLMTGNRRLDRHIEELVTMLVSDCPKVRDELPDLLNMLQSLTRLLATYAQEAIYKGRSDVLEPEFQSMVLRDLRNMLGQDVQEHPNQAGGVTDIRYRGVIVELKVEREDGSRELIAKKYASQSVQYAGVEARQVSILLVLDVTSKDRPPGDIRNDILLSDVETHGESDENKFPSKAFVFIINGNMKSPSAYSR